MNTSELIALNRDHAQRVQALVARMGEEWLKERQRQDEQAYGALLTAIPLTHRRVTLELGAGKGRAFPLLAALGFGPIIGVEIIPEFVDEALQYGMPVVWGDMHHLRFRSEVFDCVVSRHALEHAAEPERVVREVARVLRLGGYSAHIVPAFPGAELEPAHLTNWDWGMWRPVWERAGFEVVLAEYRTFADRELHMVLRKRSAVGGERG